MRGLSYSRSDKLICCFFLTLDAIKFVHCVNRLERPLPSNYFKYHHYLLRFSSLLWSASLCITGMAQAEQRRVFPSAAVSSSASAGISMTALIFSTLFYLFFPQLWQILSQAIVLWSCFPFAESLLDLSVTNFSLILGKKTHGLSSDSRLHRPLLQKSGDKRVGVQRAAWWHLSAEVPSCCQELVALHRVWWASPPASPLLVNHQSLRQQLRDGCAKPQSWSFVKYNLLFVPREVQIWWIRRICCSQRSTVERVTVLGKNNYPKMMCLRDDKMVRGQSQDWVSTITVCTVIWLSNV